MFHTTGRAPEIIRDLVASANYGNTVRALDGSLRPRACGHEERPSGELRVVTGFRGFGQPNLGSSRTPARRREPLPVLANQPWRPDLGDELRTLVGNPHPRDSATLPGALRPDAVALDLAQGCGVGSLLSRRGRSAGRPLARADTPHRAGNAARAIPAGPATGSVTKRATTSAPALPAVRSTSSGLSASNSSGQVRGD